MAAIYKELIHSLRAKIREFEDRKISGAQLSREIFHAAREIPGEEDGQLRRTLEFSGNRVMSLSERSLAQPVHQQILDVVDHIEAELVERGY